jgi:hypothetical protein
MWLPCLRPASSFDRSGCKEGNGDGKQSTKVADGYRFLPPHQIGQSDHRDNSLLSGLSSGIDGKEIKNGLAKKEAKKAA